MKNKKFALTLNLEENEDLMNEIDSLLRERVKFIIREEAEKMIGGSIQEEAQRVAQAKIANMKSYDLNSAIRQAIYSNVCWSADIRKITADVVAEWCKNNTYTIDSILSKCIHEKLDCIVQTDVLNAVIAALTAKTRETV